MRLHIVIIITISGVGHWLHAEKPQEFFAHKQGEMRQSGKNEYVLTKDDVENYGKDEIMKSFNPDLDNAAQY